MSVFDGWSDEAVLTELGDRARQMRLNRNESQSDLAARAGVSVETIRKLEDGRNVSLTTFIKVVRALGALDGLDRVLPELGPSPIQLLEMQGRRRQRASGSRHG
jgi:transcriptional regulator with XRE-family HTH domain